MEKKRVYLFGNGKAEGNAKMREQLGGKGANLAEMNLIGVPVPPGFTITTDVCNEYYEVGQEKIMAILQDDVDAAVKHIETLMNCKFGSVENPLLVSVRSGARASMPGMMDTILNLGLNDAVAEAMVKGIQGDDLADVHSMAACAKHYVGYGAAVGGRDYDEAEANRASYLRDPFVFTLTIMPKGKDK